MNPATPQTPISRLLLCCATALCLAMLAVMSACMPARAADVFDRKSASFASGTGTVLYLALGVGLPLLEDGHNGKNHALRTLDALGASTVIEEALKHVVREHRPNGGDYKSFPSGHTTAAFTIATMESAFHPRQAPLWYAGATLIGISRVRLNEHYVHDVIAGAAIGYATAKWEMRERRGIILTPFISPGDHGGGFSLNARF